MTNDNDHLINDREARAECGSPSKATWYRWRNKWPQHLTPTKISGRNYFTRQQLREFRLAMTAKNSEAVG